jgi:hypothetical protein
MPSERKRILELALESLQHKKQTIDQEIAELTRELRGGAAVPKAAKAPRRKRPRFSKEERARRAARMKAYWEKRRKEKGQGK